MLSLASGVLPRMLNPSVAAHHNDSCQRYTMHQNPSLSYLAWQIAHHSDGRHSWPC